MSVCMHLYTYTTYKPATLVVMRMLGTKHRSSAKQQVFLTTKPSLQPYLFKFKKKLSNVNFRVFISLSIY